MSSYQGDTFPSAIRMDLLKVDATKGSKEDSEDQISLKVHRDSLNEGKIAR